MKKVLFLLFTCLLLVAIVLPACKPGPAVTGPVIKIGVIGPMQYIQGEHHWWGAEMARDEINAAGGVKVLPDQPPYMVELIKADSNEINSITDASAAMEKLITVDKAQFVVGGFRTEAVFPMQEVAMDNKIIFMNCGAATLALQTPVLTNYDRYKYYFRVTPFQSGYLVQNVLMSMSMAEKIIKEDTGIQRPLNAAVFTEGAQWADAITSIMQSLIPTKLGMKVVGTWRPSPTATDCNAEMAAIQAANTDIIGEVISGPLGVPYARSWGELKVPAASVGINVESQAFTFWEATQHFGNLETGLVTLAENTAVTPKTVPFYNAFVAKTGQPPIYTGAGTYDAVYTLAEAITRAGTLDSDAVVAELEKTDRVGAGARLVFTGIDDPSKDPHDVTYGPGFSTGIAGQWQDGKLVGVWPNPNYVGYVPNDAWKTVSYEGMVKWIPRPELIDKLKAEAATQPAAPPAGEQPAAPPAGEQPAAPPAAGLATYTNTEYGFSVQYPGDWVARPELIIKPEFQKAAYGVSGFVPGFVAYAFANPPEESKDWIVTSFKATGNTMPKVTSDIKQETLADGTQAYTYKASYVSATGYGIESYVLDADKGTTRFRVNVFTIPDMAPMDEALASQVAHSLTFTK
ncbi:MAG: ABC transporter substrate-binding protein [Dehalococcoidia bacterium]